MLICADHKPLLSKMGRARLLYTNPKCSVMFLPCGAMVLTVSSRMQSSTFEQFCSSVALDLTLNERCNRYSFCAIIKKNSTKEGIRYEDINRTL